MVMFKTHQEKEIDGYPQIGCFVGQQHTSHYCLILYEFSASFTTTKVSKADVFV